MHHNGAMTNQRLVREATGASLRALGERLGLNHVTVGRRIDDGDANTCIAIARAYGQDPVEWLVSWGILTADEVKGASIDEALRDATQLQLAEALVGQIKASAVDPLVEAPLDNVHPLMSGSHTSGVDVEPDWSTMAARKGAKGSPDHNPNE